MLFPVVLIKLNDIHSLENALPLLKSNSVRDRKPEKGEWPDAETLEKRWHPIPPSRDIHITEVKNAEDQTFRYIYLRAYVERAKSTVKNSDNHFLDRKDRINSVDQNVLFFENEDNIFLAIYMNYSTYAQSKINYILKDLLYEEAWGNHTILPNDYNITDDVYYWMLRKVIMEEKILCSNPLMTLETFTGYSGNATDNAHRMTGDGERISALLGTLAFIFREDSLKSLKIHLNIGGTENILFELFKQGNIQVFEYDGEFFDGTYEEVQNLLTVYIYKNVIPEILQSYKRANDSKDWNGEKKKFFIEHVGATMIDKVKKELANNQKLDDNMANIQ
ncbi:hypothetical protein [Peribacillus frigoritolerans]|uniref:hypothetical protein n=1 Tax=Peribacillus frigoritolerans TaxID=450367 RepID=UPI00301AA99A